MIVMIESTSKLKYDYSQNLLKIACFVITCFLIFLVSFNTSKAQLDLKSEVSNKYSSAIVKIITPTSTGTGFYINDNGYLLTSRRYLTKNYELPLVLNDIKVQTSLGETHNVAEMDLLNEFPELDIAILKTNKLNSNYLPLGRSDIVSQEANIFGYKAGTILDLQHIESITILNDSPYLLCKSDNTTDYFGAPIIDNNQTVVGIIVSTADSISLGLNQNSNQSLAVKSEKLIEILNMKGLKFFTNQITAENTINSVTDIGKLDSRQLEVEIEKLKRDRALLEEERVKFFKEKFEIIQIANDSKAIIDRADAVKREIEIVRDSIERKASEINEREANLEKRELWIKQKEFEIQQKLTDRMALEFMLVPVYSYLHSTNRHNLNIRACMGLFYRFNFKRDVSGVAVKSHRIGFAYGIQKVYDIQNDFFISGYNHDLSIAAEFNDTFRIGIGKSLANDYNYLGYRSYNLAYFKVNTTAYPIPFGFALAYYTDNDFKMNNFSIGFFIGFNLTYLTF